MNTTDMNAGDSAAVAGVALVVLLVELVFLIATVAGLWRIFTKAGEPGWAAIIPFFNIYILLRIGGKPAWWLLLFLIPFVNLIMMILTYLAVTEKFGKGAGYAIGMVFLPFIFFPMLGFGDAQYQGAGSPPPLT